MQLKKKIDRIKEDLTKSSESLKRILVLDYPGAKNVTEALELAKKQRQAEEMKQAIEKVKEEISLIDFAKVSIQTREKLSLMKLETTADVRAWRDAWLIEAKKNK